MLGKGTLSCICSLSPPPPSLQGDPHNLKDVQAYLVSMFNHVRHDTSQELYRHFTTATDTKNIKVVFNIVKDTILTRHINDIMQL